MKRIILILFIGAMPIFCQAQWQPVNSSTSDTGHIYHLNGNIGLGTPAPSEKLHIKEGKLLFEVSGSANPTIYAGVANVEINKYLSLITSPNFTTASGLKAGGILIADNYSFANPGKNDLVVKGSIGLGIANPLAKLHIKGGHFVFEVPGTNPTIFTGTGNAELSNYLTLITSPNFSTASGLKAGGILVSDSYSFANPGKNNLIVKGYVGIGTANPDEKLTVKGKIHTEEVRVDLTVPGPDYVFAPDYNLLPLSEVEAFIKANKHLPEVPSAKQMEAEGLNLKEMNLLLLKKVEELTLHLIEQQKQIQELKDFANQHQKND